MTEYSKQRRYPRVRVPLLVQYKFSPLEDYLTDYSADLSRGGMFIYTEQLHAVGTLLYIQFITRDGARIIRGQGRVVRAVEAEDSSQQPGHAVEFVDFDDADARFLDGLVETVQRQQQEPELRIGRRPSTTLRSIDPRNKAKQ